MELLSAWLEKLLSAVGGGNRRHSELAKVMKVSGRGMLSHKWDISVTPAKLREQISTRGGKNIKASGRDSGAIPCLLGMTRHTTKSRKLNYLHTICPLGCLALPSPGLARKGEDIFLSGLVTVKSPHTCSC